MYELATNQEIVALAQNHPGSKVCRDLIDLILLCRAEINGITRLLVDSGYLDHRKFVRQMKEEYDYLTDVKAKQFGFTVTDVGLQYNVGGDGATS
jgi:hypothetical protein